LRNCINGNHQKTRITKYKNLIVTAESEKRKLEKINEPLDQVTPGSTAGQQLKSAGTKVQQLKFVMEEGERLIDEYYIDEALEFLERYEPWERSFMDTRTQSPDSVILFNAPQPSFAHIITRDSNTPLTGAWYYEKATVIAEQTVAAIKDLNSLEGLEGAKNEMYAAVTSFLNDGSKLLEVYTTFLLLGPSGVGKTEAAKKMAHVFKCCKMFLFGEFIVVTSNNFIGEFLGQTEPKTAMLLYTNLENIIFIDEAYALAKRDHNDKTRFQSFSNECMTEMVKFMDATKGLYCIIAAGYEREMRNDFLQVNSGLVRRFLHTIILDLLTGEQFVRIFTKALYRLSGDEYQFDTSAIKWLTDFANWTIDLLDKQMNNRLHRRKDKDAILMARIFDKQAGDANNLAEDCMTYIGVNKELMYHFESINILKHIVRTFIFNSKHDLKGLLRSDTSILYKKLVLVPTHSHDAIHVYTRSDDTMSDL
tara:strand:+ start:751 stop:2184 length:1434 start_codon:yes stop_codon:yes gene_type:complete